MDGGMGGIGSAFGGILDAFGNMAKAHNQNSLAMEQQAKSNSLATQSANTVAPALQKEFQDALNTKQMLAANGIPNIDKYNEQLDQHVANSIAQAKELGGSGDALAATLASLGHSSDQSHLALDEQDAQAHANNMNNLVNTMWQIGAEKDNNDAIKRAMQAKLNAQSGALSDAATANRYQAKNKTTDATTGLVSNVFNLGSSAAGGGGGAGNGTAGDGKEGKPATPSAGTQYQSPSYYGDNGPGDTTAPSSPISVTPTSSNMDWTMGMGG